MQKGRDEARPKLRQAALGYFATSAHHRRTADSALLVRPQRTINRFFC
jgi:hypothetical protein